MRRREFILGGITIACPITARAQQAAMPVIGYLYPGSPQTSAQFLSAFRKGLAEAGYVEGQNVAIEYRWAVSNDRLRELADDLVRLHVSVIVVPANTPAAIAAKAATTTIPIVFGIGSDPVRDGLVANFNRPGGNATGITFLSGEIGAKCVGLLHDLLPRATNFAVLVNPENFLFEALIADIRAAAAKIGVQIQILAASVSRDIEAAFASLVQKPVDALIVGPDALLNSRRVQIVTLAARRAVPAIYPNRDFTEVGGLVSYGSNLADAIRQVGVYTGRVLRGEKPADLPVLESTKLELVINISTAKALGLAIPPGVLAIADEVIE
jgi:putative tryptophan/tyrosine transport system substrate-binding protein